MVRSRDSDGMPTKSGREAVTFQIWSDLIQHASKTLVIADIQHVFTYTS